MTTPDERRPNGNASDELWVRTPGGFGGGARGGTILVFLAIVVFGVAVVWIGSLEHAKVEASLGRMEAAHVDMLRLIVATAQAQRDMVQALETQNYLTATPEKYRPRLPMPPHLYRQLTESPKAPQ